ncbi:hypothetical protein [Sphingomonas glaciei]|uniref:Uncharacterized protein n=1 Tax=Sphingomonas glaciei TaxID=2938948 RepID=A0ABY5MUF4_9SPHN|nr:hypothetical protein [Sphingomonas glaciei]UUR08124.1 hypothetical protein M1K48_00275 [Sphingomonas glaciei]
MLIGTGQFARTEKLIRLVATKVVVPEVIAALDRSADQVRIEGWDTIGARMEEARCYLHGDNKGREWRAVILGLRNDTGVTNLRVETLFSLSDQARLWHPLTDFLSDFQIKRQERELATQARVPDTDLVTMDVAPLRLLGLDDLYAVEVNQPVSWSEQRECTQGLAAAAILLRFHQAVERHAMTDGLPHGLPLYATVRPVSRPMEVNALNFGEVATRRLSPVVGNFEARTADLVAEAKQAREAEFVHDTRRLISQMREREAVLARWPVWHNPFKRHGFAEQVQREQRLTRDALQHMHGIETGNANGETLIRLLVEARHGKVTPELLADLPAQDRSELHQISMAYAKMFGGRRVRAHLMAHPDRPAIVDEIG